MAAGPRASAADRAASWIVTGPVGRVAAFAGDLGAALGKALLRRFRPRRDAE